MVLTKQYKFTEDDTVKILDEGLCGDLKKDLGSTSEIYAKIVMRAGPVGTSGLPGLGLIFGNIKITTPTVRVKVAKK